VHDDETSDVKRIICDKINYKQKLIINHAANRGNIMNKTTFIKELYKTVDNKNIEKLSDFIADNVHFRIANYDPVIGKEAALESNRSFFSSITSMAHRIDNIWECGDDLICNGNVDYIRLNGSEYSVPFATVLKIKNDKIIEYLVYVDISLL